MRLALLEFNELTPELIERFIGEGKLPNFKAFRDASTVYTTDAGEDPPFLEPWIAWPTIHSGVTYARHGAYHLGDGPKNPYPGVAKVLSEAGIPVGVFGSMNTNYRDLNGYYVPDPWDGARTPEPASLQPYFSFVARNVQEHTNEKSSVGGSRQFVSFLLRNGLRPATALRLAKQLLDERIDRDVRWRRALMLDFVQYDVFRSLNARHRVEFATFFSNTVAHFQHYFWRNMDPKGFDHPPSGSDSPSLSRAVELGYRAADDLIGNFLRDYPDAVLVFCTALSQQKWRETTKCCYRPKDFNTLLTFAGIDETPRVIPVMAEEFELACKNEAAASSVAEKLRGLEFRGSPVMKLQQHGASLFTGCGYHDPLDGNEFDEPVKSAGTRSTPFRELFYQISTMRSGKHHRDGSFWIRNGNHRVVQERLPITAIAPMLLEHFGLQVPDYMHVGPETAAV